MCIRASTLHFRMKGVGDSCTPVQSDDGVMIAFMMDALGSFAGICIELHLCHLV